MKVVKTTLKFVKTYYEKKVETVIFNNSANINKTNDHFSFLITEHKYDHVI